MLLPDPVAPVSATTSPGRTVNRQAVEHRRALGVREAHVGDRRPRGGRPGRPVRTDGSGIGAASVAMTSSSRSTDTTARGSDSRRKPSTRIGSVRMANRAMASTSSPVVTAPSDSRQVPMPSRAMVPRLGRVSSAGSKAARR